MAFDEINSTFDWKNYFGNFFEEAKEEKSIKASRIKKHQDLGVGSVTCVYMQKISRSALASFLTRSVCTTRCN